MYFEREDVPAWKLLRQLLEEPQNRLDGAEQEVKEWIPEVIDPPSPTTSAVIKTIVADQRLPPDPELGPSRAQQGCSSSSSEMPLPRCRQRCQWGEYHGPAHQCTRECRRGARHEGLCDCCQHTPRLSFGHECGKRCSYFDPWSADEDQQCTHACKLVHGHRDRGWDCDCMNHFPTEVNAFKTSRDYAAELEAYNSAQLTNQAVDMMYARAQSLYPELFGDRACAASSSTVPKAPPPILHENQRSAAPSSSAGMPVAKAPPPMMFFPRVDGSELRHIPGSDGSSSNFSNMRTDSPISETPTTSDRPTSSDSDGDATKPAKPWSPPRPLPREIPAMQISASFAEETVEEITDLITQREMGTQTTMWYNMQTTRMAEWCSGYTIRQAFRSAKIHCRCSHCVCWKGVEPPTAQREVGIQSMMTSIHYTRAGLEVRHPRVLPPSYQGVTVHRIIANN